MSLVKKNVCYAKRTLDLFEQSLKSEYANHSAKITSKNDLVHHITIDNSVFVCNKNLQSTVTAVIFC